MLFEMVEFIRKNRISTTEVADALGKTGVLDGIGPAIPDLHCVGPARAVFAANDSNYAVHEQMRDVQPGEIPVVYTQGYSNRAVFGDIVSKYVTLYQGAEAVVVDGLVRDAARIRRERFPVWSRGYTPLGAVNSPADPFDETKASRIRADVDGGIAVCDDAGVVIIPAAKVNSETLGRLEFIEAQEDVWYFCLDTLKWDTKQIVCDKAYLDPANIDRIPVELIGKLSPRDS